MRELSYHEKEKKARDHGKKSITTNKTVNTSNYGWVEGEKTL